MTGPPRAMKPGEVIDGMIPQGGSLMGNARIAKEYLGMLVGR